MIKPMLAQDFHKDLSQRKIKKYAEDNSKFFVQPKLDGIRVVADLATGILYKRSGVEVENCPHINKDVLDLGFIIPGYNYVDGELYNHKLDFSEINSLVSRTVNILDTKCIELHLFDVTDDDPFEIRSSVVGHAVKTLRNNIQNSSIYSVETYEYSSMNDVLARHKLFIQDGYEGTMLRLNNIPYEYKRSNQLYKIKDFTDSEFIIVGCNEEENHPGYLGSFEVSDVSGNTFAVRPAVTREIRKEYWNTRSSLVNAKLTVRYQEISKDGIPRFPIGVDIRCDLDEEIKKYDPKPDVPIHDTNFHRGW